MNTMIHRSSYTGDCSNSEPKKQKMGSSQSGGSKTHTVSHKVSAEPKGKGKITSPTGKGIRNPSVSPHKSLHLHPTSSTGTATLPTPQPYTPTFACRKCSRKRNKFRHRSSARSSGQLGVKNTSQWKKTVKKSCMLAPPPHPPSEVIENSDTAVAGSTRPPPPHPPKGVSMRKSLRIQAQADPSSTLTKAKTRARNKEIGSCSKSGIPLINNFPYQRLTFEQVRDLFRVYKIQLGSTADEATTIIKNIQRSNRASLEQYLYALVDKSKKLDDSHMLVLHNTDIPSLDSAPTAVESEIFHDTIDSLDIVMYAGDSIVY